MYSRRKGRRFSARSSAATSELASLEYYLARNLFSWMRADYRTLVDYGGGDVRVSAFPDKVALVSEGAVAPNARSVDPAHAFAQGTQANQALAPVSHASFGGQLVVSNANANIGYTTSIAIGNWKLHSAAHAIYVGARSATQSWGCVFGTMNAGASAHGVHGTLARSAGTPGQQVAMGYVGNGTATLHVDNTGDVGSAPYNTARVYAWKYRLNTDHSILSATPKTVAVSGSASSSNPANNLVLFGGNVYGAVAFLGQASDVMFFNREPTAAEDAMVQRYFLLRYGLS